MRNSFLVPFIVGSIGLCSLGEAEIFEAPLPELLGEYVPEGFGRQIRIDLGFPLAEIRDVRFRVEGTAVAAFVAGPFTPPGYRDVYFQMNLGATWATGPSAGAATHPEPEPFAGEVAFLSLGHPPADWSFLEDGTAWLAISLGVAGQLDIESRIMGGSARITAATLIINATRVPEPGLGAAVLVGMGILRQRRRSDRRCQVGLKT